MKAQRGEISCVAKVTKGALNPAHSSKEGNYTSISVKMVMMDVDSIMTLYYKASEIEGIIIL